MHKLSASIKKKKIKILELSLPMIPTPCKVFSQLLFLPPVCEIFLFYLYSFISNSHNDVPQEAQRNIGVGRF